MIRVGVLQLNSDHLDANKSLLPPDMLKSGTHEPSPKAHLTGLRKKSSSLQHFQAHQDKGQHVTSVCNLSSEKLSI
jgi:hypothetical protein